MKTPIKITKRFNSKEITPNDSSKNNTECQVLKRFHMDLAHVGDNCLNYAVFECEVDAYSSLFANFRRKLNVGLIRDGLKAVMDLKSTRGNYDKDGNERERTKEYEGKL
eukprot:GHVR01190397.1.p1 GENE.GHVR01190397.1~~GHVR01190397.1.p1  ORF type:complete len:109 (+),score=12.24 GHVR01190397.1:232-558(+)